MLILKQNAANTVPVPPAGKGTIFLDDSDTLSVKTSDGNVETFPTVAASNTQVVYIDGTSLSGDNDFVWNKNTNILTINGNIAAGNVKTDNLLYANGQPWDLQQPGGSNTQIQFNDADSFGGSAAFTFNKTSNVITASGNINANNFNATAHVTSGNVWANSGTIGAAQFTGDAGNLSNITGGNVTGAVATATNAGTVTTASQPNITSVGTLTGLAMGGDIIPSADSTYDLGNSTNRFRDLWLSGTSLKIGGGTITANATAVVITNPVGGQVVVGGTSVANSAAIVNGTSNVIVSASGNVNTSVAGSANVFTVTSTGANIAGTLNATGNANAGNVGATGGYFTTVAGSLTTASQPNITSVGVLSSLAVTGNVTSGNVYANSGTIGASSLTGTLTTAAQTNITSVGTLTGLGVNGNITAANITANTGVFTGNGAGLTNIPGANIVGSITGNISNANYAAFAGQVVDSAQSNITSVGTLSSLTVSGNASAGNLNTAGKVVASTLESNVAQGTAPFVVASTTKVANLNADLLDGYSTATAATVDTVVLRDANGSFSANIVTANLSGNATTAGTVVTASQPNITSVGTLTGLGVNGTITGVNITANTGVFTGNGSGLTNLAGGNVTGQVANALVAGTVYTNAQPNITSVGTLSSLAVTANVTAGNVYANSGTIGASLLTGTLTTAAQPNITSVGTLSSLTATGNVAAGNLTTTGILSVTGTGVSSIAGNLDMTSNTIINLANPTNDQDAATKYYVDTVAQGLHVHDSCYVATTGTLDAASGGTVSYNNGSSGVGATLTTTGTYLLIDGGNVQTVGTRILVKNEANAAWNGIYTYTSTTVLTRATDFDTSAEAAGGDFLFVTSGTTQADTGWVQTTDNPTIGTSNIVFTQFSGAGTYSAGTGLTLTGTTFSVNASQTQVTALGTVTTGTWNSLVGSSATFAAGLSGANLASITGANVTGQVANATVAGTVYTNAQPNITSVGTLTSLAVTGNITAGNVTGANLMSANYFTGTLTTAAQPNITSVGTLTSLGVSGTITAPNFTANTGVFTGNGNGLSSLQGANLTGTIATGVLGNSTLYVGTTAIALNRGTGAQSLTGITSIDGYASTVSTAAQPNITSVGTLTSLTVTGNITGGNLLGPHANGNSNVNIPAAAGNINLSVNGTANVLVVTGTGVNVAGTLNTGSGVITGNGSGLSSLTGANVTGTVSAATTAGTVTTAAQPNITSVGTLTSLGVSGAVTASTLVSNVATGTAPFTVTSTTQVANLNVATAGTAGTVTTAAQPNITSVGTLTSLGVSGTITAPNFTANTGVFTGNGNGLSSLQGANFTGTINSTVLGNSTLYVGTTAIALNRGTGAQSLTGITSIDGYAATVSTAAQPNITSVGTLTSLGVSGNITGPNIVANTGYHFRSINAAVSAAGTVQGNATAIAREVNVVSTVASGAGVVLPTAVAGMCVHLINTAANALLVYPASGGKINALATDAAYTIGASSAMLQFIAVSATQWYTAGATYS